MHALSTAKWPRPKSGDEWEEMALDAMRLRWRYPNAQRNGRCGQRQHGVDIFGKMGTSSVAAQAKNMDALSEGDAISEIVKAERFQPSLHDFYLVIGGPRDASFQEFIRLLSNDRNSNGKFSVHVLFFEDVCQELALDIFLIQKYWGDFLLKLNALVNAVPKALTGPILDEEAALDRLCTLKEFKAFAEHLETTSNHEVRALMIVERAPKLDAPRGSLDRSWQIAIGESHKSRIIKLWRVAIDIDSGMFSFCRSDKEEWLSHEEWRDTYLWFL